MQSSWEYRPYHLVYSHASGNAVYLGDLTSATNLNFLHSQHITTVVTAALGMDQLEYSQMQLTHILYPLLDAKRPSASHLFSKFFEILEKQIKEGNVLVHCSSGVSRAPTLVISYLMRKQGWSFKEALQYIRSKGRKVMPTLGFERQLKTYEEFLKSPASQQSKTISKSKRKYSYRARLNQGQLPSLSLFPLPLHSSSLKLSPSPVNSVFSTIISKRQAATHQLRRQRISSCDSGAILENRVKGGSMNICHSAEDNNFEVKRVMISKRLSKAQTISRPLMLI